jgi:hypothetical protein
MHVPTHSKSIIVAQNLSVDYLLSASPNSGCRFAHHAIVQKSTYQTISRLSYGFVFREFDLVPKLVYN